MAYDGISPIITEGAVSATSSAPDFQLGTRVHKAGVDYIYIYNAAANSTISKGQIARIPAESLGNTYSCTITNAASQAGHEMIVGVAHNATIATGYYGFVATRGLVCVALDASAVSMNSGDLLAAGVDGGFVVAPATMSTGIRLGYAVNSLVTTVGTGKAQFKSPIFG